MFSIAWTNRLVVVSVRWVTSIEREAAAYEVAISEARPGPDGANAGYRRYGPCARS